MPCTSALRLLMTIMLLAVVDQSGPAPECHRALPPLAMVCTGNAPLKRPEMDPATAGRPYGTWRGGFGGGPAWHEGQ